MTIRLNIVSEISQLCVLPSANGFGADITGVNLSLPLNEADIQAINEAWLAHGVVFFPGQTMTPSMLEVFTLSMGSYGKTDFVVPMDGHTNVLELRREPEESASHFGGSWHSDFSYQQEPPAATILYGHTIPPVGGDTLFADGRAACLALSDKLRDFLRGLKGVHSAAPSYSKEGAFGDEDDSSRTMKIVASDAANETRTHPIIRAHPDTGEEILWVNSVYTIGIDGLTEAEGKVILDYLVEFTISDRFVYRHQWQQGTLAMWDNRRVQHFAESGFDGHRRVMYRTTTAGTVPAQ